MEYISEEQINFYQKNGYLIIENFAKDEDIDLLKKRTQEIIDDFDMEQIKIFTTDEQSQHTDDYFLESGDKIRCFFEEEALNKYQELLVDKQLAVNKIGHAMHDLHPDFERFSYQKSLLEIVKALGLLEPTVAQSQYIFKQPNIGAKVNPHTDSTFIHTKPLSCLGAWVALEDASEQNGCLCAIPGSHLLPLQQRFVRDKTNKGTEFVPTKEEKVTWKIEEMIPLEVKKGSLVLLHGQVVHASYANRSSNSRHAYILHLVDLSSEWSKDNWLQRSSTMPFRKMENVVKMLNKR